MRYITSGMDETCLLTFTLYSIWSLRVVDHRVHLAFCKLQKVRCTLASSRIVGCGECTFFICCILLLSMKTKAPLTSSVLQGKSANSLKFLLLALKWYMYITLLYRGSDLSIVIFPIYGNTEAIQARGHSGIMTRFYTIFLGSEKKNLRVETCDAASSENFPYPVQVWDLKS